MKWSFTTWKKLKSGGSGGDGERRKSNVILEGAQSRWAGGARRQGSPARAHAEGDPRPHTSCETLQHGDKRRGGADFQRRRGVTKGEEIRNGTGLLNGHTAGEKTTKRHPRHPRGERFQATGGKTFSDMPPLTNVTSHAPPDSRNRGSDTQTGGRKLLLTIERSKQHVRPLRREERSADPAPTRVTPGNATLGERKATCRTATYTARPGRVLVSGEREDGGAGSDC